MVFLEQIDHPRKIKTIDRGKLPQLAGESGPGPGAKVGDSFDALTVGKAEIIGQGADILLIAVGACVPGALSARRKLAKLNVGAAVVNARFVKPLDSDCLCELAEKIPFVVTIEENVLSGGFGSAVLVRQPDHRRFEPVVGGVGFSRSAHCGGPDRLEGRLGAAQSMISISIKLAAVAALGASPLAVLIFEVVLNAAAMFNHGNIRIPEKVDRWVRLVVVTPDMHRVHHSVIIRETNSNYGFNLPWWDRLMGAYKAQPAKGHADMTIGLSQFRDPQKLTLRRLLILPFTGDPGRVPINRH